MSPFQFPYAIFCVLMSYISSCNPYNLQTTPEQAHLVTIKACNYWKLRYHSCLLVVHLFIISPVLCGDYQLLNSWWPSCTSEFCPWGLFHWIFGCFQQNCFSPIENQVLFIRVSRSRTLPHGFLFILANFGSNILLSALMVDFVRHPGYVQGLDNPNKPSTVLFKFSLITYRD